MAARSSRNATKRRREQEQQGGGESKSSKQSVGDSGGHVAEASGGWAGGLWWTPLADLVVLESAPRESERRKTAAVGNVSYGNSFLKSAKKNHFVPASEVRMAAPPTRG